jgi:hypothetical protein
MEVQNIAGPDVMQSTFSAERPQPEKISADNNSKTSPKPAPVEQGRGESIDTYA